MIGSSSRGGARARLVCGHTAEGARTARNLAAYFNRPGVNASSHVCIDADETLTIVPRSRASWTLRTGNPISMNAEICGFAHWTREQWLSTGTVDGCRNPKAMLDRFADWVRSECQHWGIPKDKLSPTEVARGKRGVIHHIDWTQGMRDGTHWDCGPGFPWDYVMARVAGGGGASPAPAPIPEGTDMSFHPEPLPDTNGEWEYLSFPVECGKGSSVVADLWFTLYSAWGSDAEYVLYASNYDGELIGSDRLRGNGPLPGGTVPERTRYHWKLPDECNGIGLKYKTNANNQLSYAFPQRAK